MSEMNGSEVTQLFPVRKQVPLEGLYLGQNLLATAKQAGRSIVVADFVTDKNGVVAVADKPGRFRIPAALRSTSDWGLFQELMAQTDVVISSGAYFRRLAAPGHVQDILYQFETGHAFERLGNWRLGTGYASRHPDLAVVSRHLDFELPDELVRGRRRTTVFTTDAMAKSERARTFDSARTLVVASGGEGVDGNTVVTTLAEQMGYRVIMMASGPGVLELLLAANRLDLLYVTQAQRALPVHDPALAQTMLSAARRVAALEQFSLAHEYVQQDVVADDGSRMAQRYLRYDRRDSGLLGRAPPDGT